MTRPNRYACIALACAVLVLGAPTIRADFNDLVTVCREIDQQGVAGYVTKRIEEGVDDAAKSVLSLLPGNADGVAEAGEQTYSLMDRALKQVKHMIDTESTDGEAEFWEATGKQAADMAWDALVPDSVKRRVEQLEAAAENAQWLTDKAVEGAQKTRDFLFGGEGSTTGGDWAADGWQGLGLEGETATDAGASAYDVAELAAGFESPASAHDGYPGADEGGTFAEEFNEVASEAFKAAEELMGGLMPQPKHGQTVYEALSPEQLAVTVWNYPEYEDERRQQAGKCDESGVAMLLADQLEDVSFAERPNGACWSERKQLAFSSKQAQILEPCSQRSHFSGIAEALRRELPVFQKNLNDCMAKEQERLRQEQEAERKRLEGCRYLTSDGIPACNK